MNDDRQHTEGPGITVPTTLAVGVLLLWGLSGYLLYYRQDRGTFGDMFGAVNALFSGLAFAGVVYAILLQRRELQLQRRELELTRNELELTRNELEGQKEMLSAQNATLQKQNFESTYFQLLRLQNDIVNNLDVRRAVSGEVVTGRDCFMLLYGQRFGQILSKMPTNGAEVERVNRAYLAFHAENEFEIGHYFRTLYNLVKFVDRSNIDNKKAYTSLIRAQLSSYELLLLFYNCLSDVGREKFKPLIEKYALLKTLSRARVHNQEHLSYYAKSAYN